MRATRKAASAAALALLLGISACGGDDGGDEASPDAPTDEGADEGTGGPDTGSGSEGTCAGTDVEFTNLTTGTTVEITDTAAVSMADGAAYTAYLADFDIDPEELSSFSSPTVPDDGNMVNVFITTFNAEDTPPPLEAGTEITYTDELGVLTFGLVHMAGAQSFGSSVDAAGTATVTSVGDTLCVEVDYADAEKTLSGTFEAGVKAV